MTRVLLPLAALLLGLSVSAQTATQLPAEELPPLPTYTVQRAAKAPVIDGRMDPGEWDVAALVSLSYWWPQQTGPKQTTTARVLWDDDALYVAYQCDDANITAVYTERDDPTYKDDCCEIFLAPRPDKWPGAYVGLEMSARATMYDYFWQHGSVLLKAFDLEGWRLATTVTGTLNMMGDTDEGWVLEVAIPFDNVADFFGMGREHTPQPGDVWHAQINRWDGVEPDRALALWSHSGMKGANPHNYERFGTLVFAGEQNANP